MTDGNATSFLQDRFKERISEAEAARRKVAREAAFRKAIAYALRGTAILGGVAVAAGVPQPWSHAIGVAIAAAVGLDALVSNHVQLVAKTRGTQAYRRVIREIQQRHTVGLEPILRLKANDPKGADERLSALLTELMTKLHQDTDAIVVALDEVDLKVLAGLAMDQKEPRGVHGIVDGGKS